MITRYKARQRARSRHASTRHGTPRHEGAQLFTEKPLRCCCRREFEPRNQRGKAGDGGRRSGGRQRDSVASAAKVRARTGARVRNVLPFYFTHAYVRTAPCTAHMHAHARACVTPRAKARHAMLPWRARRERAINQKRAYGARAIPRSAFLPCLERRCHITFNVLSCRPPSNGVLPGVVAAACVRWRQALWRARRRARNAWRRAQRV